jgi:gamma-glutamylcyclotransferase (GGCT)/AIG2-like uncharacterized protein YtfP
VTETPLAAATTATASTPLFVYGTLMDPDVLNTVCIGAAAEITTQPAIVKGFKRRLVVNQSFPVLVSAADESVLGLLIHGLSKENVHRAQFFEGEQYELAAMTVEALPDSHATGYATGPCNAQYFASTGHYQVQADDWHLPTWQQQHKRDFLPRLHRYMQCYGHMSMAEADAHW